MTPVDARTPLHGGPDSTGVARHDFSTNANAFGPCPMVLDAVRRADAGRYPDPDYVALRKTLGDFHGVAFERIVIAASASEFIHRITGALMQLGGRRVWLPAHGYGDYRRAAEARGLRTLREPASLATADLAWLCDPSSPLGQAQAGIGSWVDALGTRCVGVLDMAYEPLRLEGRLDLAQARRDRVWQLWTPNKAMGLTGIRAAYAVAPNDRADLVALVHRLAPSWPVGAHGVALLDAWTHDAAQAWLAQSHHTLRDWKAEQQAMCASLGWTCLPSVANFYCLRTDLAYADHAGTLRDAGIKLRDASDFGLAGHVRLGVLPPSSQRALRMAWQSLLPPRKLGMGG